MSLFLMNGKGWVTCDFFLSLVSVSYRATPANADGVFRDDQSWRQLLALEFIRRMLDLVKDRDNEFRIVARGDDLGRRRFLFEVHFQDRIHDLVGWKRVLVKLVR